MDIYHFNHLLSQVTALNERYKKINELTGESFNVFRILKLEASEVRMHSAFIAEMLNPQGSHGKKDLFLKLFVNTFCFKGNNVDTASSKVEVEKHTGFISIDGTEGGRIDIIITDKDRNQIIIENKIYAGDQSNQLVRYYKHSPTADLIYLTLDGKEPTAISSQDLINGEHFQCASYKTDIISWLESCRKETSTMPILRESITQYINLIKYLTNQTISDAMKNELSDIILSNLEASFLIADGLDQSLDKVLIQFDQQLKEISADLNMDYTCNIDIAFNKPSRGFWFWSRDWQYFSIGFQFSNYDKNLIYGIATQNDPIKLPVPLSLREELSKRTSIPVKVNSWWPVYYNMDAPFNNWDKYEAWKAIIDGRMKSLIVEKINYLLNLANGVKF